MIDSKAETGIELKRTNLKRKGAKTQGRKGKEFLDRINRMEIGHRGTEGTEETAESKIRMTNAIRDA